jgi:hypothetical protein
MRLPEDAHRASNAQARTPHGVYAKLHRSFLFKWLMDCLSQGRAKSAAGARNRVCPNAALHRLVMAIHSLHSGARGVSMETKSYVEAA